MLDDSERTGNLHLTLDHQQKHRLGSADNQHCGDEGRIRGSRLDQQSLGPSNLGRPSRRHDGQFPEAMSGSPHKNLVPPATATQHTTLD